MPPAKRSFGLCSLCSAENNGCALADPTIAPSVWPSGISNNQNSESVFQSTEMAVAARIFPRMASRRCPGGIGIRSNCSCMPKSSLNSEPPPTVRIVVRPCRSKKAAEASHLHGLRIIGECASNGWIDHFFHHSKNIFLWAAAPPPANWPGHAQNPRPATGN